MTLRLLLLRRSWRSWWTTMIMATYFKSSPSQFRIGPLSSWKSFKDTTTRLEGATDILALPSPSAYQHLAVTRWLKSIIHPQGFGAGNFKSLFEAIEADQHARGNLTVLTSNGISKNIWCADPQMELSSYNKKYESKNKSMFINAHVVVFMTLVQMFLIAVSIEDHCFCFMTCTMQYFHLPLTPTLAWLKLKTVLALMNENI